MLLVIFCEPADSREFYDLGESVNYLDSCYSEDCGESTDSEEFVVSGEYDDSGNSVESGDPDEYGEPGSLGEYGKFAHFGDPGKSHNNGGSRASYDSVNSGNFDEFVNLVIVVILLNLQLMLRFCSGESGDFGKFFHSGNLDQYG